MKLLFDQNLSFKLCQDIADLFDGSEHVRDLGLTEADDRAIWSYAQEHAFMIVSQDADFADMAILLGSPPQSGLDSGGQSAASDACRITSAARRTDR